jgi:hypothetical protein
MPPQSSRRACRRPQLHTAIPQERRESLPWCHDDALPSAHTRRRPAACTRGHPARPPPAADTSAAISGHHHHFPLPAWSSRGPLAMASPVDDDHLFAGVRFVLVGFDSISKSQVRLLLFPISPREPSLIPHGYAPRSAEPLTSGVVVRSCSTGRRWCGATGGIHIVPCGQSELRLQLLDVWWS